MVPEPPVVGLVSSQPHAVDTGLLARPDTDDLNDAERRKRDERSPNVQLLLTSPARSHLPVFGVADRVGLGELHSDGGHHEVTHGFLRQLHTHTHT